MTAKNDITGDSIQTKVSSDSYRDNHEKIFGKSKLQQRADTERALDEMTRINQELGLYDEQDDKRTY